MLGHCGPKHVAVCVLKHYINSDEICALVCHIVTIKYIGSSLGIGVIFSFCICCIGDRGNTVVKVLCYKSEGRWFDPSWCQWNFH